MGGGGGSSLVYVYEPWLRLSMPFTWDRFTKHSSSFFPWLPTVPTVPTVPAVPSISLFCLTECSLDALTVGDGACDVGNVEGLYVFKYSVGNMMEKNCRYWTCLLVDFASSIFSLR